MDAFWARIRKNAFLEKKSPFGPKLPFWAQKALLAPKVFLAKSAILSKKCPLEISRTHIQVTSNATWPHRSPKKWIFAPKITFWLQNAFWAQKLLLGAKVHFLRKIALLRPHAADAYKTSGFLMEFHPFWHKKRFWARQVHSCAKKAVLGPKVQKWATNAVLGKKCKFRKSGQKLTTGSACRI